MGGWGDLANGHYPQFRNVIITNIQCLESDLQTVKLCIMFVIGVNRYAMTVASNILVYLVAWAFFGVGHSEREITSAV